MAKEILFDYGSTRNAINAFLETNKNRFKRYYNKVGNFIDEKYDFTDEKFAELLGLYFSRLWYKYLNSVLKKNEKFNIRSVVPTIVIYPALRKLKLRTTMDIQNLFNETLDVINDPVRFNDETILDFSEVMQRTVPIVYHSEYKKYFDEFYSIVPVDPQILEMVPGSVSVLKEDKEQCKKDFIKILKKELEEEVNFD